MSECGVLTPKIPNRMHYERSSSSTNGNSAVSICVITHKFKLARPNVLCHVGLRMNLQRRNCGAPSRDKLPLLWCCCLPIHCEFWSPYAKVYEACGGLCSSVYFCLGS